MSRFLDIIVPYYENTNEMIIRLLNSINQQVGIEKNEIGVILVNDKSTFAVDNAVLENFKELNIEHLFNDVNVGPGLSRQFGLENSESEYVTFVDADDLLYGPNILKEVIEYLKKNNPDVLLSYFFRFDRNNNTKYVMTYDDLLCLHGAFYNRRKLIDGGYSFNKNILYYEDSYFCRITKYTLNVEYIDIPTYIWIVNDNGMGAIGNKNGLAIQKRIIDYVNSNLDVIDFIYKKGMLDKEYFVRILFDTFIVVESELFAGFDVSSLEDQIFSFFLKYKDYYSLPNSSVQAIWYEACRVANKNYGITKIKREFDKFVFDKENMK